MWNLYLSNECISKSKPVFNGLLCPSYAACELTWKYFFPNEDIPEIVRLLGRYDCFGHKGTDEEQKVLEFQYGARSHMSNYNDCYNILLNDIEFKGDYSRLIADNGKHIYNYLCIYEYHIYIYIYSISNISIYIT